MMRWDSFARSATFAAIVALACIPWLVLFGPVAGAATARALYLILVTSAYVGGLGGRIGRRLPAAIITALAGLTVSVVGRDPIVLCLGLGGVLAVARSVFLHHAAPARAVVSEVVLVGGGLVFARLLAARSPLGTALAIWGFFLVQSCFFLIAGVRARRAHGQHPDPFEAAHARAMEVLERPI